MTLRTTESHIGGDGALERYPSPFRDVSGDLVTAAAKADTQIIQFKREMEVSFLKMAYMLNVIDQEHLYLGLGYETLRAYVGTVDVGLTWRTATDLLRIVREARPALEAAGYDDADDLLLRAGVSKVRAALPLLRDEQTAHTFAPLIAEAPTLTTNDVKQEVKRLRGHEQPLDTASPAIFRARVRTGTEFYRVTVTCGDGMDLYTAGELRVRPHHWPRFEGRFGVLFSEIINE